MPTIIRDDLLVIGPSQLSTGRAIPLVYSGIPRELYCSLVESHYLMNTAPSRIAKSSSPTSPASFVSPLRTLSESLQDPEGLYITARDIEEAYSVLSRRIRAAEPVLSGPQSGTITSVFKQYASILDQCISREIRRVAPNPFESQPRHGLEDSFYVDSTEEDPYDAMTHHSLCLRALDLLTALFMHHALYSVFQGETFHYYSSPP